MQGPSRVAFLIFCSRIVNTFYCPALLNPQGSVFFSVLTMAPIKIATLTPDAFTFHALTLDTLHLLQVHLLLVHMLLQLYLTQAFLAVQNPAGRAVVYGTP